MQRATSRDYDAGNTADLFNVVYDTYDRDGFSNKACNRCLLDTRVSSCPQHV